MDVQEGELISLVGPSGCGKTTVLKILAGLHDADGGTIKIGNARTPFDPARDIGMVFQQALLLKWRTILDNVLLPAEIVGLPMKAARNRARDLLNLVGLAGYEDKYPQQLSGGMQQRTAIARAFIHDPKLILMDEPFGALDALTREQMNLEMLRIWRESGKTIIFVTHSIQEAVFLASHCAVLTAGPARMAEYFPIELPFPRALPIKTTDEFGAYARRIYASLGLGPTRRADVIAMTGRANLLLDLARIHLDDGIEQFAGESAFHRKRLFHAEIGLHQFVVLLHPPVVDPAQSLGGREFVGHQIFDAPPLQLLLLPIEAGDLVEQRLQARLEVGDAGGIGFLRDAHEILRQFRVLLQERAVDDQRIAIGLRPMSFQFSEPRSLPNSFSLISCEL